MDRPSEAPVKKRSRHIKRLGPNHYLFAKLAGEGKTQYDAFITVNPHAADWQRSSIDSEASKWANSPKIREQIELHAIGAQEYGRAVLPQAIARTAHLVTHAEKEETQLKAADSIADRFGAPRNAQIALDSRTLSLSLITEIETPKALQEATRGIDPHSPVGVLETDSLPQTLQEMTEARDSWALIEAEPSVDKG